jgi:hypothetical protein
MVSFNMHSMMVIISSPVHIKHPEIKPWFREFPHHWDIEWEPVSTDGIPPLLGKSRSAGTAACLVEHLC